MSTTRTEELRDCLVTRLEVVPDEKDRAALRGGVEELAEIASGMEAATRKEVLRLLLLEAPDHMWGFDRRVATQACHTIGDFLAERFAGVVTEGVKVPDVPAAAEADRSHT